jgi:hypothetical protein
VRASTKCCGGGTFETALPRAGPDLEPIHPLLRSVPILGSIMAIRRKAKDHCAVACRMSSVVAGKALAIGRCRASRRTTDCGLPDS